MCKLCLIYIKVVISSIILLYFKKHLVESTNPNQEEPIGVSILILILEFRPNYRPKKYHFRSAVSIWDTELETH